MSWARLAAETMPPATASMAAVPISTARRLAAGGSAAEPAIFGELIPKLPLVGGDILGQLVAAEEHVALGPPAQPRLPFVRLAHLRHHAQVEGRLLLGDTPRQPHGPGHLKPLDRQAGFQARRHVRPGLPRR